MRGASRRGSTLNLVLASASPRRRQLLSALGLPFTVQAADIDEQPLPGGEAARFLAARLALRKSQTPVTGRHALALGADTVVVLDGQILGKPIDETEATAMLRALRRRTHQVVTAVALCDQEADRVLLALATSTVTMRGYTNDEIAASVAAGTPFDKAGGYAIQDKRLTPVAHLEGCYCAVMGLPLWSLRRIVRQVRPGLTVRPPDETLPRCAGCPLRRG